MEKVCKRPEDSEITWKLLATELKQGRRNLFFPEENIWREVFPVIADYNNCI